MSFSKQSTTAPTSTWARSARPTTQRQATRTPGEASRSTQRTGDKTHVSSLTAIPIATPSALHEKLCSKTRTPRQSTQRAKKPVLPTLPNELLLLVLETMPTPQICTMRTVSRTYAKLGSLVVARRMQDRVGPLTQQHIEASAAFATAQATFGAHLDHYKQFLRGAAPSDLTEALWYSNPPEELRAVCECLCRLKGIPDTEPKSKSRKGSASTDSSAVDLASLKPMPWSAIKKIMVRYEFKKWLLNLQVNVDAIPQSSVRVVEHIIMVAPDINYDHVRGVSLAGYRLLILVAACLQYANISNDLREKREAALALQKTLANHRRFLNAVNGPPPPPTEMVAPAAE